MPYKTGALLVVTAGLLWSFQALIIRQLGEAGSWAVLFWRSSGMLPVLLAFIAWRSRGSLGAAMRSAGIAGLIGGVALVAAMGGAIVAFQSTTIANAAFLLAASPLISAALARIVLKEEVSARTRIAILIALVGIFVMVREGLANGAWLGNIAALVSASGFAAFTITLRWRHLDDSLPSVAIGAVLAMSASMFVAAQLGQPILVRTPDIIWCLLMGAVTLAGGMILYTLGSKAVPSAELALLSNTEVMLAPLWVWLVMDETASIGTFVGGAILFAGIAFNAIGATRKAVQPDRKPSEPATAPCG